MAISIVDFNETSRAKVKDRTGQRHGKLVAVSFEGIHSGSRSAIWRCLCDCGKFVSILTKGFGTSGTKSCGCIRSDIGKKKPINWRVNVTHGDAGRGRTTEYITWHSMIQRCSNAKHPSYNLYGGRGITVCTDWRSSYECFLRDMGRKPSKTHSLDRINPDIGYEKSNCRWATVKEQQNNRRDNRHVIFHGVDMTCTALAETIGVPQRTVFNWINKCDGNLDAFIDAKLAKRRAKALLPR
jgi:hypothetical protein